MQRALRFSVPALTVWSLLIWGSRIRNILADDLEGIELLWRLGLAGLFVVAALWVIRSAIVLWRDGATDWWSCVSGAAVVLAGLNVVIWPVRAVQIFLGEWGAGFKIVHTLLAIVSVGLGLLVAWHRYGRAGNRRSVQHRDSIPGAV